MKKRTHTRSAARRPPARRGSRRGWLSNPAVQLAMPGMEQTPSGLFIPRAKTVGGPRAQEAAVMYGPANFMDAEHSDRRREGALTPAQKRAYARHRAHEAVYGPMTKKQAQAHERKLKAAAKKAKRAAAAKKAAATRAANKKKKGGTVAKKRKKAKKAGPKKRTAAQRSASAKKAARTRRANLKAAGVKTTKRASGKRKGAKRKGAKRSAARRVHAAIPVQSVSIQVRKRGKKRGFSALKLSGKGMKMLRNPGIPSVAIESAKIVGGAAAGTALSFFLGQASTKIENIYAQAAFVGVGTMALVAIGAMAGLPSMTTASGMMGGSQLFGMAQNIVANRNNTVAGVVKRPGVSGLVSGVPSPRNQENARREERFGGGGVGSLFGLETQRRYG